MFPVGSALSISVEISFDAEGTIIIDGKAAVGAKIYIGYGAGRIVVQVRSAGIVNQLTTGDGIVERGVVVITP